MLIRQHLELHRVKCYKRRVQQVVPSNLQQSPLIYLIYQTFPEIRKLKHPMTYGVMKLNVWWETILSISLFYKVSEGHYVGKLQSWLSTYATRNRGTHWWHLTEIWQCVWNCRRQWKLTIPVYSASQKDNEDVLEWSCRLEDLLNKWFRMARCHKQTLIKCCKICFGMVCQRTLRTLRVIYSRNLHNSMIKEKPSVRLNRINLEGKTVRN